MITNACATQAILSVLLNAPPSVDIGETLGDLKTFTADFDAQTRGFALGNAEAIRVAHNSFNRPDPFVHEERSATKDDDVFHFISYVPALGALWELDGLKQGPIRLGELDGQQDGNAWLAAAVPHIQARIERYAASEIRFNLLAVTKDPSAVADERLGELRARLDAVTDEGERAMIASAMADEEAKKAAAAQRKEEWRVENLRRKHDFVPFLLKTMEIMAEKGVLSTAVDKAQAQAEEMMKKEQQQQ